ncbi:MAG TPA: 7-carboxy-7-deazaguanine synthase QueE [Methylococcaceae bacterium]|jgi:7-carboxy-7-deazaguanine synthase|nr:7-carboxy-7-deazaguanine synthase QueE [Methylococcaceae bacterium]HIA45989.1 7-carboxy-7-deazaguanine synthase QueE [Methylococcaceae bacterium]HIB62632.1 7-carboxy-7-deazaguanine synthase QueE [Methylococcaceae bacterium]HIN68348.1 7-carboxy-7-deazaguanine synthase QueE [Methylococcales bacterium]HIO45234.1 7-carboxy-7-deazaguanine synthase QueE [Methylococcales bacterium]
MIRITEIFYSLQGESNCVGLPTVFVRLTGCPLRCSYCDTAYAFHGGEKMTVEDIITEVSRYDTGYVTVTGGEPMAQAGCVELLDSLVDKGYSVSLETSGAIDLEKVNSSVVKVMDIKVPSSQEDHRNRYENLAYLTQKDQVKFVIGDEQDYEWSKEQIVKYRLPDFCEVLFSPIMGRQDPADLANKILRDQLPVRFQVQLHKLLWGDTPGK